MVDRKTKLLLALLATAVVIVVAGVVVSSGLERLADARFLAARSEERIARLHRSLPPVAEVNAARSTLRAEIGAATARFYRADEMNPYLFGTIVRQKLAGLGIAIQRYQVVDVKGTSFVELSATGSARSFVTLLREVSRSEKIWTVPSMSMTFHDGSDSVEAAMRIGYAVADAAGR